MTIKVTREYEIDNIGWRLLHNAFLESNDAVIYNDNVYFNQLNDFQKIEVLEAMKEQFNNAIDDEIEITKRRVQWLTVVNKG